MYIPKSRREENEKLKSICVTNVTGQLVKFKLRRKIFTPHFAVPG